MLSKAEQRLVEDVSTEGLMEVTRKVAEWVRLSGSTAEMKAFEYLRDKLEGYGIPTDLITHPAYISLPGEASILLPDTGEGEQSLECITHSFSAPTPQGGLEGAIVDVGSEENPPPERVKGKIVLRDGLAMAGRVKTLEDAGALAQVFVNGPITHEMIVSTVWGSPGSRNLREMPETTILSVTDDVASEIRARREESIRLFAEVDTCWTDIPLLTAGIKGASEEEFVLFSGHVDSWHYGAMDNGSANATMVEVARLLAYSDEPLGRTVRLAFWSGHSHGRYAGSAWYADHNWFDLHRHCVAHVNIDSVGGRDATVLSEGISTASLRNLGRETIDEVTGEKFDGSRVGRSGDQSFVGMGVPSLWMSLSEQAPSDDPSAKAFAHLVGDSKSGGLGWWWHTTEDTIDKIDPDLLERDAKIYALAVSRLANDRILPLSPVAEASDVLNHLQKLHNTSSGRFDLSMVLGRTREAVAWCEKLERRGRQLLDTNASDDVFHRYNQTITRVLQKLLGINYSAAGSFGQDPARGMPPLPLLADIEKLSRLDEGSDEARFLCVELLRARNRFVFELEDAISTVEREVGGYEG